MLVEDMTVRNLAPTTQATYVHQVSMFARHFGRSPEMLGPEEIRSYQVHLAMEKKLAPSSISTAVAALRFLYNETLHKHWALEEVIVDQGKGQKDRYVMLSLRLLETLRHWWRTERPQHWLFPGKSASKPITRHAVEKACQEAYSRCRIPKPITPHSFRHAFAVHMLENGTDVRTIQLLLGHRSLSTTANYLRIATTKVCSATSPLDLLPRPVDAKAFLPPQHN